MMSQQLNQRSSLTWLTILVITLVYSIGQLSCVPQEALHASAATAAAAVHSKSPILDDKSINIGLLKYEEFKKTPFFVDPYDPEIVIMPEIQKEYIKTVLAEDMELYRTILKEAIANKNKFAPSVPLMLKYGGKLIARFIKERHDEQKLIERMEPKSSFFGYVANLAEKIMDMSVVIKKERGYSKNAVNTDELYRRFDALLNYIAAVMLNSPVGGYIKWDGLILFRGDGPAFERPLVDEAADLTAQFRGMGYEKCIFVARRIVNLLRMFSRGLVPSSESDVL